MTEKKQVYRFFKVAKELNVGIPTLADHLSAKGYDISGSPNEKLSEEMYDILLRDFASEKVLKEKAEQIREKKAEAAASVEEPVVEEEPLLSAEDLRENLFGPKPAKPKETPEAEKPAEEPKKEEAPTPVEKVEEAPVEKTEEEANTPGIKVVGKIDLESLNPKKGKPKAKKEEPPKEEKAPKPKEEAPVVEEKVAEEKPVEKKPEEKAPEVKKEEKVEAPVAKTEPVKAEEEKPEPEAKMLAKDHTPKLGGLTIKGKIDLSKVESKSRKSSSKPSDSGPNSRTRKRRPRRPSGTTAVNPSQVDANKKGRGRGKERQKKEELSDKEIQEQIKQTLAELKKGASRKRQSGRRGKRDLHAQRRAAEELRREEESAILEVTEFITANEFANLIDVNVTEIITKCMELGLFVSINQRLDAEVITLLAEEYNYEVKFVDVTEAGEDEEIDDEGLEDDQDRAPIVTVMGHVDHGKTSLLDYIRSANVIAGEAGGITQHIGAYNVEVHKDGRKITFLDTPGHEAFTAMRARGAKVTDVVIIVIAADDNVMPQTKEAINHAQAAGAPMVFALNKVDKPTANPDKIREELANMNILLEDWGGEYQSQEISAKTGQGVEELMEKVLLQAELLELKANDQKVARGTVIEARLDKGRGVVATLLVQNGTLRVGDTLVAGVHFAKVKAMTDERGNRIKEAGPSMPVQILGLSGVPQAGDNFIVYQEEKKAKDIANKRTELYRQQAMRQNKHITLEEVARRKALGDFKQLDIIIKGDVDGSIEALADSLLKLSTDELLVNIVTKAVGQISESDVLLASASDAIIIGFQVRPSSQARATAEREGIDIRLYRIIYDAIHDVRDALEGMLSPEIKEEINGTAEIREVFKISKVGSVGGCMITNGKVFRNDPIRLIRDGIVIYEGKLASLKRFKDDVKEVATGFECGLQVDNYNDIKVGDLVESYRELEVKRKLK